MIVGISYLHGLYAILLKSTSVKTIDSKELHKLRNGAIVSMCLSLKENWKRYPWVSCESYIHLHCTKRTCTFMTYKFAVSYSLSHTFVFYICVSETSSRHYLEPG